MDNRWKKTVIRSTRFSPVLMDMIKTECKCRRIDFSNYIRLAATAAMKHKKRAVVPKPQRETSKSTRKMKMTNHIISKRRLKPFKQFLPECLQRTGQWQALGKTLNEDTIEMAITGASAIVIDSALTDEERAKAINDFAEDIANMSGERIVAIAVVTD